MALYNAEYIGKTAGATAVGKTGVYESALQLKNTSLAGLPFGLQNIPYPFARTEKRGALRNPVGLPMQGTPVLVSDMVLDGIKLQPAIITVQGRKNVITTAVAGKDISVKEIISLEDWAVKIHGFCISPMQGEFPEAELIKIIKTFRKNQAIPVECEYLRHFNIFDLVITDINFPDMAGYSDVVAWEIDALSDEVVELELS
jgi:hypothetical protein